MTTLVVGASGATGRLLVEQLLAKKENVRVIVRSINDLPLTLKKNCQLLITESSLLDMTDEALSQQVQGCSAVISCLGHNLTLNGMFGHPKRLVTDAVKRLTHAIVESMPVIPVKFILMNTTGNQNVQAGERISMAQSIVLGLIRLLLPPHLDNELAATYLQSSFGENQKLIEWVTVRPDSLIDQELVTEYDVHASPIRSAIFDAGNTSRINVAHFMSELIASGEIWGNWKFQMPVIYNAL
ncbi:MAG: NAD(P)-binding oxidoreductase [Halioglobus sp.]